MNPKRLRRPLAALVLGGTAAFLGAVSTAHAFTNPPIQLQLSGHTHGGQFFPWNLFVPMQQPFTAGLHRLHDMWVYVSRGTGYWGPPKRFGAPSEITLLTLVPAKA